MCKIFFEIYELKSGKNLKVFNGLNMNKNIFTQKLLQNHGSPSQYYNPLQSPPKIFEDLRCNSVIN